MSTYYVSGTVTNRQNPVFPCSLHSIPFSPRIMVYIRNDYVKQFSINFAFSELA